MVMRAYEPTTVVGEIWEDLSIRCLLFTGDKGSYFSQQSTKIPPHLIAGLPKSRIQGILLFTSSICALATNGNQPKIDTLQQKQECIACFKRFWKTQEWREQFFWGGFGDAGTGATRKIYLATSERCPRNLEVDVRFSRYFLYTAIWQHPKGSSLMSCATLSPSNARLNVKTAGYCLAS